MDAKDQELRDFFAAMALCGMLAHDDGTFSGMAEAAYRAADAMMEARKPKEKQ